LLGQLLFGIAVMVAVVSWGAPDAELWAGMSGAQRAVQISLWIAAGVASYLFALRVAGMRLSILWSPADKSDRTL